MLRAFRRSAAPSSRGQLLRAIHAQARTLGMDDDTRRELQRNLTGAESCADMDVRQLRAVYHRLASLSAALPAGAKPYFLKKDGGRRRPGRDERQPEEPITAEQMAKIKHLCEHVNFAGPLLRNFSSWCKRTCGQAWPQTRAEGNKVIEALKAMERRGWKAREART